MILRRIKIVICIVILTSILGSILLFIGNWNRKNYKINDNDYKKFEIQDVSNKKLSE